MQDDDIDFSEEDFHDSHGIEHDISDIRFTAFRNKNLTKIDLIAKSDRHMSMMRYYLALRAYVFKIEMEMSISEEDGSEH